MILTDQQRAELKALADAVRSIANGCGSQRSFEQLCKASKYIHALLADLEEAEANGAQWKANHDNVVNKLRLFTQREDLPVDRLPAYQYVLKLEADLASTQKRLAERSSFCTKEMEGVKE